MGSFQVWLRCQLYVADGKPGISDPAMTAKSEVAQVLVKVILVPFNPSLLKLIDLSPAPAISQPCPKILFEIVNPLMILFFPSAPLNLKVC